MYKDKDYKNIFYLIINYNLTKQNKYQELIPYKDVLRNLFVSGVPYSDIKSFVKRSLELVNRNKNHLYYIDSTLIDVCANEDNSMRTIDNLNLVFFPEEIININFGYYLNSFYNLIHEALDNVYNYSFNYPKFNELYEYVKEASNIEGFNKNLHIITTMLAKKYLNNDNDYSDISEYLTDMEFYNDVFKMNGYDFNFYFSSNFYGKLYKEFYDNYEFFFNKNKKIIK